jgi:polyferredoxin
LSSSANRKAKQWHGTRAAWPLSAALARATASPQALGGASQRSALTVWRDNAVADLGQWLKRHQPLIQRVQWAVVLVYLLLVAVPAFLPLPDRLAHIWTNLTLLAQFCFWGLWWPFVLLSMILVGRAWCGLMCPEGSLTEAVSRHGKGLPIPGWLKWKGWPFVAFSCTTIYGQMISVYQYPKPVLLILGGSTAGALVIGYLYGRNKRVWCRYLCPVNGVFGLLAKLAPLHFNVDSEAWERSRAAPTAHRHTGGDPAHHIFEPINCAPLVAVRTMKGGSDCHMCGRCDGFRGAVTLQFRSPAHEIVEIAGNHPKPWETVLILFGMMGVAVGAFHWGASPWFIDVKQAAALWLIDHGMTWVLAVQPPWWILTHYPEHSDTMTLLDGGVLIGYILATAVAMGALLSVSLAAAAAVTASSRPFMARFHHYAQALIPMAGCGVILGLSALTVTLLRNEGFALGFVPTLRLALLGGAAVWSLSLAWKIAGFYGISRVRQAAATVLFSTAVTIGVLSWLLLFFIW